MKPRRIVGIALVALVSALVLDVAVTLLVIPTYWRPLPPFGATTNQAQRAWVGRQRIQLELGFGAETGGIGRFDALLGWSNSPNTTSHDDLSHINSRGWRGAREYDEDPSPDAIRIVACGDSFTFCQEVSDEDTWPAILEASWPEAEVINLGVGGYGTDQAYLRYQGESTGTRVDVVLIGLLLENIGRNVNRFRPWWYPNADSAPTKPRFLLEDGELRLIEQPFATRAELIAAIESGEVTELVQEHEYWSDPYVPAYLRWSGIVRMLSGKRAYEDRGLARLWTDTQGEPFLTTMAVVEAFHAFAKDERGARFAPVLVFPIEQDLEGLLESDERYWTTLTDALDAAGIAYLDLSGPLAGAERARGPNDPSLYLGSHLSRAGNEVIARCVHEWLAARLE